ncbi:MAG: MBOAT family protein [Bacteroidia bacterium]|nr:MBOAT family protein [Bacteroidia bacterium]
MIFNSTAYAFFLFIIFILYWLVPTKKVSIQNVLLLTASYFFYAWWDIRFLGLIVLTSTVDFTSSFFLSKTKTNWKRILWLITSLSINLGLLFYFKYFNFLIDTVNYFLNEFNSPTQYSFKDIILPIGISFYTFQSLSYTIDVYRKKIDAIQNPITYFVFVSFFPQIAAGPIEKASDLLTQFKNKRIFNTGQIKEGLRLILWGVFKKVVVADMLATYVDVVYSSPNNYTGLSSIFAALFFTLQLYCDFSGYSDMAIGSGKLLGFKLTKNFNTPFFAKTMNEFWTRWHITLNTWFRDYIYIPLGGNRNGKFHRYKNIFIVFLISGLWHGASWKFVFWGVFHGIILIIELLTKDSIFSIKKINKLIKNNTAINVFHSVKVFLIYAFSLIFFRANTFADAVTTIKNIPIQLSYQLSSFENFKNEILYLFLDIREFITVILTIILFVSLDFIWRKRGIEKELENKTKQKRWIIYYALILIIFLVGEIDDASSFVYFQF